MARFFISLCSSASMRTTPKAVRSKSMLSSTLISAPSTSSEKKSKTDERSVHKI